MSLLRSLNANVAAYSNDVAPTALPMSAAVLYSLMGKEEAPPYRTDGDKS